MSIMMTTTSVDCWPLLLRPLKKSFLNQTLSFMTFCPYSKAVLMLLQNGTCYRYGEFKFESSSRRASTQQFCKPSPFPISNVVGMARGFSHILLLTDQGQIWSFGHNQQGQLGQNYADIETTFDQKLIVSPHKFISISCGSDHSLALTDDGNVFAWGSNSCGQLGVESSRMTSQHSLFFQVSKLNCHRVIEIKCGWEHSVALTEQGVVFGWGSNHRGQLGFPKSHPIKRLNYHPPTRLDTNIVGPVKCIAAGHDHTLLLTQCGLVFACGGGSQNNPYFCLQQLTKVTALPLITQIVANFMSDLSIMIAPDRSYYILTNIDSTSMIPIKLPPFYSTIDSVFAMFQSDIPYSIPFEGQKRTRLLDRLSRMFDNRDTNPDIQFLIEDKTINVHRCILQTSSSSAYFNRLFPENHCFEPTDSNGSSNTIIAITDYIYSIFHSYLRYLYTAILPKITSKNILKFLQLSITYEDNNLQYYCLSRVFDALSLKNWSKYFKFSVSYQLSHFQITLANWIISECGPSIFTTKRFLSLSVTLQEKLKILIKNVDINSKCQFVVESNSTESKPDDDDDYADSDVDTEDSEPETDLNSNSDSSEFNPDSYPPYSPLCGPDFYSDSYSNSNPNSDSSFDSVADAYYLDGLEEYESYEFGEGFDYSNYHHIFD